MKKILALDFEPMIIGSGEGRSLEFKPGLVWNEPESRKLQEEIIKAMIAMSNTPSGGLIILGIESHTKKHKSIITGIDNQCYKSFNDYVEQIQQKVHSHCSQPIDFSFFEAETDKICGKKQKFIVIKISEFSIYPTLCTMSGGKLEDNNKHHVLEKDTLYVRSKAAPWSSKKASAQEFEEVVRLAADKYREDLTKRGYTKIDSKKDFDKKLYTERSDYE